jgi:heme/copper-type cytochrome/quinol oxidase subunit 4
MSETDSVDFKSHFRRCLYVFGVVICTTALMIFVSYMPHYGWTAKVAMILTMACVNAFILVGFLMHLLSERKMIYTVLSITAIFFVGLMGLTIWAMHDLPVGSSH